MTGTAVRSGPTRRRHLAALASSSAAVVSAAACGIGSTPAGGPTPTRRAVAVSLLTNWGAAARLEIMQQAVAEFQRRSAPVTVAFEPKPNDGMLALIVSRAAAGTPSDVTLAAEGNLDELAERGLLLDVTTNFKKVKTDELELPALAGPGEYEKDGKRYGMPFQFLAYGYFYTGSSTSSGTACAGGTCPGSWAAAAG